jgi:hypothetical protein
MPVWTSARTAAHSLLRRLAAPGTVGHEVDRFNAAQLAPCPLSDDGVALGSALIEVETFALLASVARGARSAATLAATIAEGRSHRGAAEKGRAGLS